MARRIWYVHGFDIFDLEIERETTKFYYVSTPRAYGVFRPQNPIFPTRVPKGERVHDDLQSALVQLLEVLNAKAIYAQEQYERKIDDLTQRVREVTAMIKKGDT